MIRPEFAEVQIEQGRFSGLSVFIVGSFLSIFSDCGLAFNQKELLMPLIIDRNGTWGNKTMSRLSCAAILLLASVAPLKSNPAACDSAERYKPIEVRTSGMIDGDTLTTDLPINVFDNTKFLRVRVFGIDTPESRKPPAKCDNEVKAGLAAKEFARSLVKRGDLVTVKYCSPDKYGGRVVGRVILADGRDFGDTMIAAGHARPYGIDGSLKKSNWCNSAPKKKD